MKLITTLKYILLLMLPGFMEMMTLVWINTNGLTAKNALIAALIGIILIIIIKNLIKEMKGTGGTNHVIKSAFYTGIPILFVIGTLTIILGLLVLSVSR